MREGSIKRSKNRGISILVSEEVGETACDSKWTEVWLDLKLSCGDEAADLSSNRNPTFQLITQMQVYCS
jgi:hypothetical protein